ncbi:MAG: Z1 domain-containing protein [Thermoleophilaceae bacterium]
MTSQDVYDDADPDVDLAAGTRPLEDQRQGQDDRRPLPACRLHRLHRHALRQRPDRPPRRGSRRSTSDLFPEDFILTLPDQAGLRRHQSPLRPRRARRQPGGRRRGTRRHPVHPRLGDERRSSRSAFAPPTSSPRFPTRSSRRWRTGYSPPAACLVALRRRRDHPPCSSTPARAPACQNELGPQIACARRNARVRNGAMGATASSEGCENAGRRSSGPSPCAPFPDRDRPFDDIEPHIDRLMRDPVPVLVLNSTTDDQMDFDVDPNLKAIVIGGNRLSRGVTLEGLAVSYYVRRTPYYDTLLQMARWFRVPRADRRPDPPLHHRGARQLVSRSRPARGGAATSRFRRPRPSV